MPQLTTEFHVVKEAIQSSSSLPFIINFNLFVKEKTLTDYSMYFKEVIQYYYSVQCLLNRGFLTIESCKYNLL